MRRSLLTALVSTAVAGATCGTLVGLHLDPGSARGRDEPVATDPAGPGQDPSAAPGTPVPSQDDRSEQVLWATSDEIHDGDTVVDLERDLNTDRDGDVYVDKAPVVLQRAAQGWVVNVGSDTDKATTTEVFVVSPAGRVRSLAKVVGLGDVSPDGARYVGQDPGGDGYTVWDLASGDRVGSVPSGSEPGQRPDGRAQFVGLDSVATAWTSAGREEVVLGVLGSEDRTVLADDLYGPWSVSPDGRWLTGTLAAVTNGAADYGCVVIRPLDGSDDGRTDCGGGFIPMAGQTPVPTFSDDSTAVLTAERGVGILGDPEFGNPDFRLVPTGDNPVPPEIEAPMTAFTAVLLTPGRVAVMGPKDFDLAEETRVHLCEAGTGCRVVGSTTDDFLFTVLGTAY